MKFLLVLLAIASVATSHEFQERIDAYDRSISSQVIEYIEKIQKQMPCGFPRLGLGPLSPARLSHREIALNSDSLAIGGEINDFILYGLDDFDIVNLRINVILSKITFEFKWPKMHFDTKYNMNMNTGNNKWKLGLNGRAKLAIEDLTVVGSAKYSMLRIKELKVSATIGDAKSEIENLSSMKIVNKKLNEIVEEWILMVVNENTKEMEQLSNKFVVPLVNDKIGDATLSDLLALILGGGGGSQENQEECIPAEAIAKDVL